MQDRINKIYNFKCPRWEDLPDNIYSTEIVEYFKTNFSTIFIDGDALTKNMINNYVKWKVLSAPKGRKYSRDQIAVIITIRIFKQVISIQDVADGVQLQNKIMDVKTAYNVMAQMLEEGLRKVFGQIVNNEKQVEYSFKKLEFSSYKTCVDTLGILSLITAFSFKLLTKIIIVEKGSKNIL